MIVAAAKEWAAGILVFAVLGGMIIALVFDIWRSYRSGKTTESNQAGGPRQIHRATDPGRFSDELVGKCIFIAGLAAVIVYVIFFRLNR